MREEFNELFWIKQIEKLDRALFCHKALKKWPEYSSSGAKHSTTSRVLVASFVLYNKTEHSQGFSTCQMRADL